MQSFVRIEIKCLNKLHAFFELIEKKKNANFDYDV